MQVSIQKVELLKGMGVLTKSMHLIACTITAIKKTANFPSLSQPFVTLVSALFTGLTLKMTPSWHVYCVCTLHMIT